MSNWNELHGENVQNENSKRHSVSPRRGYICTYVPHLPLTLEGFDPGWKSTKLHVSIQWWYDRWICTLLLRLQVMMNIHLHIAMSIQHLSFFIIFFWLFSSCTHVTCKKSQGSTRWIFFHFSLYFDIGLSIVYFQRKWSRQGQDAT